MGTHPVRLRLRVRRFFCDRVACRRVTFSEPFTDLVQPYARRSERLEGLYERLAHAMSAEAASRVVQILGVPVSSDTLLRIVLRSPLPAPGTVRILSVDDWAWRKGQRYGTLLCDLERRRPVDLLADRTPDSLATWLASHPGVQVVVRDRAEVYAHGARQGAPDAIQVADRWHLLKNLGEALERYFQSLPLPVLFFDGGSKQGAAPEKVAEQKRPTRRQAEKAVRRARRQERFDEVQRLSAQGVGTREISRRLHLSRTTVRRYLRSSTVPDWGSRPRRGSKLDPYRGYIEQRWEQGCHNGKQIFRELCQMGYSGSRALVAAIVASLRCMPQVSVSGEARLPQPLRITPRQLCRLFWKDDTQHSAAESAYLAALARQEPRFREVLRLAKEFVAMVRQKRPNDLDGWIRETRGSDARSLSAFAQRIEKDFQAVYAGIALPWNNGMIEGFINKLKALKRMMYGRAGIELLRHRLLYGT